MPKVMGLGGRVLGRWLDYRGGALMNENLASKQEAQRAPLPILPWEAMMGSCNFACGKGLSPET